METTKLKGVDQTINWLKAKRLETEKAMNTAIRVEGFRLKNKLQLEIRQGSPGGMTFKPLSFIARRLNHKVQTMGGQTQRLSPNRRPLARLALGVRYHVPCIQPYTVAVGWVGPRTGSDASDARDIGLGRGISPGHVSSDSWRRLARMHQTGFNQTISQAQRRWIVRRGANLGTIEGGDTPFFLRRSTRAFNTPARPIMEPFWRANKTEARQRIKRNFSAKLQGKRI